MFNFKIYNKISSIDANQWNKCAGNSNPFLSYIFFKNLEDSNAIGENTSWVPNYISIILKNDIVAFVPLFIKLDSQGEYVFDHSWANAFYNAGGNYYPKIQSSVPFTPVSGNRILIKEGLDKKLTKKIIISAGNYIEKLVDKNNFSSAHITFCTFEEQSSLSQLNFLPRIGEQYHWQNNNYKTFNHFLDSLSSRKRKAINKERNFIKNSKVNILSKTGEQISDLDLENMYNFYIDTSNKKWGRAYLNKEFFKLLNDNFRNKKLLIFAEQSSNIIAGAMHIIGKDTLYGRYWGCINEIKYLHFELCYYQAIEWAIKHKKKYVEGGAQGPHKIQRGYLPVKTFSSHYISNISFRDAVKKYLKEEEEIISNDIALINKKYSPFKNKN